jgi:membrane dipeptidase
MEISQGQENAGDRLFFVDGHVDIPYFLQRLDRVVPFGRLHQGPFTPAGLRQAGGRCFCTALYCEDRFNGDGALPHFKELLRFTLDHLDPVTPIRNKQDFAALDESSAALGTLLLLENADALAADPEAVPFLKAQGIRMVGLTHAGKNRLADGNGIQHSDGLTDTGKAVVRRLIEHDLLIDIAHLHATCFRQLVRMVDAPMISSHTGVRKAFDIPRNIDLDQAEQLIERGGVVGITLNPEMLAPGNRAGLEDVFVHMDILVQRFGPDGIGVGSDFCGFDDPAEGLEDVSKVPALAARLSHAGYDDAAVRKIMGRNWWRLYERLFS